MMMKLEHYFKELSKQKDLSKRILVYKSLEKENGFEFLKNATSSNRLLHQHLASLLSGILTDVVHSNEESVHLLLNIINSIYLNAETIAECPIDNLVAIEFLKKLLKILSTSKSNDLIQKILSIMGLQCFQQSAVDEVIGLILPSISVSNTLSDQTIIVVINKFMEQCPESMQLHTHVSVWLKLLLSLTCHTNLLIREKAVAALKQNLPIILKNKAKIIAICATFLKEEVLPNLNTLNEKESILNEILTCQLPIFMKIIGEDYKRSSRLSNSLLKFVEKGFCQTGERIKLSAFKAWDCLIECFAENKDLLASTKYFNLFTQPLRIKLKTEAITKALLETMWKLAQRLDDNLPDLFEMLCVPLFGTCFKGSTGVMQQRRSSGRLSLSRQQSPYTSVRLYGAEMISHLLLPSTVQVYTFRLGPLREPFLGKSAMFARFYSILIPTVKDMICQLHEELPDGFLLNIWNHTLKCVQDAVNRKREADIFRSLYRAACDIVSLEIDSQLLLTIVSSLISFPNKILNSSLHYQSESAGESMHGTPIVSVLNLLFSANVRRGNMGNKKFLECAQHVIAIGMDRRIGNLEFIRSVVNQLPTCDAVFLTIWEFLAKQICSYLETTGNVNDGDSLEHDFSSLYQTLLYPFQFIFNSNLVLEESVSSPVELTWSNLFRIFSNCTSIISSSDRNEAREYMAAQFLDKLNSFKSEYNPASFSFLGRILFEILTGADFSNEQAITKKPHRKKNLNEPVETSLLTGFNLTAEKLIDAVETFFIDSSLFPPFNILSSIDVIISNVPQPLVKPFFMRVLNIVFEYIVDLTRLNDEQIEALEQTWSNMLLRLNFTETLFDDDNVSQVFAVAFSDPKFYKSTLDFWNMKVPNDFDISNLPEILRNVISTVLKKEGYLVICDEPRPDEALNLNFSVLSERSDNINDEENASNSIVAESDVSSSSLTSNDCTPEITSDDISDVSHDEKSNNITKGENDDVISDTSQETDNNNTTSDVSLENENDDISDVVDDDDITQLEKAYISSDDETDVSNRSLNLRSLACAREKKKGFLTVQTSTTHCRRSPRLAGVKLSELNRLSSHNKLKSIKNSTLDEVDDNLDVIETSAENRITNQSKASSIVCESDEETIDNSLSAGQNCSSDEENVTTNSTSTFDEVESAEESFYTCRDTNATSESLYEVAEMENASVNIDMEDLTINSSLDQPNISHKEPTDEIGSSEKADATSESLYEVLEMENASVNIDMDDITINSSLDQSSISHKESTDHKRNLEENAKTDSKAVVVSNDCNTTDNTVSDEGGAMVEVAETSIMPDTSFFKIPVGENSLERSNAIIEISTDSQEYEDVEMQEISIHPEFPQENITDTSENCSPARTSVSKCDNSIEKLENDEDTEEYEYVEVQEMSLCPESNHIKSIDSFKNDELTETTVSKNDDSSVSNQGDSAVSNHNDLAVSNHNDTAVLNHDYTAVSNHNMPAVSNCADSTVFSHNDSTASNHDDSSKRLEKVQETNSASIQSNKPVSSRGNSTYEMVEKKRITVNIEPFNPHSITDNERVSSCLLSTKTREEAEKEFSDVQNPIFRETDLSREDNSIIQDSQVSDVGDGQAERKSSISSQKNETNLKVSRDESFNAFVRDLEVQPLNSSFEASDFEANKDTISEEGGPISDTNKDVIECSEPQSKPIQLPESKTSEKRPRITPELKKASTPIKGKLRKRIKQCKTKNLEAELPKETDTSSTHPTEIPDVCVNKDVVECDDVRDKEMTQSNIEEANVTQPNADDASQTNCTTTDDVTSVMETASSPASQQNTAGLQGIVVSPPASERKDEEIATPKSRLGKRLLCISREKDISPAGSPCGILKKQVSDGLSPATKGWPDVPRSFGDLLEQCLQPHALADANHSYQLWDKHLCFVFHYNTRCGPGNEDVKKANEFQLRRVSFAEPISTSTICPPSDNEYRSPLSSPSHFKKLRSRRPSGRVVNRRLSLPIPLWSYESTSPRSVRSVQIAAAIADIKSRNGDTNSNSNATNSTSSKSAEFDIESIKLTQLYDLNFLKTLTAQQLHSILDILVNANPVLYSLLISKLKES